MSSISKTAICLNVTNLKSDLNDICKGNSYLEKTAAVPYISDCVLWAVCVRCASAVGLGTRQSGGQRYLDINIYVCFPSIDNMSFSFTEQGK